jgi:hypothetical protein
VAKSVARQLATAVLWVRIRRTRARQKNIQKKRMGAVLILIQNTGHAEIGFFYPGSRNSDPRGYRTFLTPISHDNYILLGLGEDPEGELAADEEFQQKDLSDEQLIAQYLGKQSFNINTSKFSFHNTTSVLEEEPL